MIKSRLFKVFNIIAILFFVSNSFIFGQVTSSRASGRSVGKTREVAQSEARFNQIIAEVGDHFKKGLFHLQDNRRSNAREEFDKTIEVFLLSNVNVQSNQKLRECYSQLTETIYRMEFPSGNQPANIRSLSATCGWNIDNGLADKIAKIVQTTPIISTDNTALVASANNGNQTNTVQGFTEQKFEASPLDELAKLELTPDEKQIENNPVAERQYQYIQYAVSNKSLGFSFQVHPMIQQFVNYYQGRGRATMATGLYRSGMFMRMARRIFREEGIPENVAWLGQVESAWKPAALSWASASGLWQFIPGTGARYGLRRTAQLDERNSFEQATRASAKYLKFLANRYGGNWELAMAGYNSGEGNVDRAIRRAGVANFWVAYPYLPKETRDYVPNILATILIANNPNQYGFGHIRPAQPLLYDQIRVPPSTNLSLLAQASDTSVEYLRYLNPHLRSNVSPPEPYIINVPPGKANEVVAVFRKLPAASRNMASVTKTAAGETWQNIANRTGVSVEQLQAANAGAVVPRGKVVIPNGNGVRRTSYTRPTTQVKLPQIGGVRTVKAQNGDTVAKVAQRYGASPVEVAKFNGLLITSPLPAGREIKIP
ncbi:MAG TPA: transglycosylase SLT domain-containing protein [Pyrinomonadaceae bacterium]|nr:transglycosylase SLT domain-containing protein [Pyrinomonadaceae bacterium]